MINTTITSNAIKFYSTVANSEIDAKLIEPKWEIVDEQSMHIICDAGVYCFGTTSTTFNDKQFDNSDDALSYLNNL